MMLSNLSEVITKIKFAIQGNYQLSSTSPGRNTKLELHAHLSSYGGAITVTDILRIGLGPLRACFRVRTVISPAVKVQEECPLRRAHPQINTNAPPGDALKRTQLLGLILTGDTRALAHTYQARPLAAERCSVHPQGGEWLSRAFGPARLPAPFKLHPLHSAASDSASIGAAYARRASMSSEMPPISK